MIETINPSDNGEVVNRPNKTSGAHGAHRAVPGGEAARVPNCGQSSPPAAASEPLSGRTRCADQFDQNPCIILFRLPSCAFAFRCRTGRPDHFFEFSEASV
jgi:hypothetical protein